MRLCRALLVFLAGALGGFDPGLRADAIEWVLPWNDSMPGVTDFATHGRQDFHDTRRHLQGRFYLV